MIRAYFSIALVVGQATALSAQAPSTVGTRLPWIIKQEEWPVGLRGPREQLERFESTGDRNAAVNALSGFVSYLGHDATGMAHYGAGRALVVAPFLRPAPALIYPSSSDAARFALKKSLSINPRLAEASVTLAYAAVRSGRRDLVREAIGYLKPNVADTPGPLLESIVRLAMITADPAEIRSVAELLRNVAQRSPAFRLLALAEALDQNRPKVAVYYDSALATLTPDAVPALLDDIRELRNSSQQVADPGPQWFHEFWRINSSKSGQPPGERIAEHYTRLTRAIKDFGRMGGDSEWIPAQGALAWKSQSSLYDDRGAVLIKHGEPEKIVRTVGAHMRSGESWIYRPPRDGVAMFNFALFPDASGYKLLEDPAASVDWSEMGTATRSSSQLPNLPPELLRSLANGGTLDEFANWFRDRAEAEPRYALLGARLALVSNYVRTGAWDRAIDALTDYSFDNASLTAVQHERALAALSSDSYIRRFARDLLFASDGYRFRNPDGSARLYNVVVFPLDSLRPAPDGTVGLHATVAVTDGTAAGVSDSIIRFRPSTGSVGRQVRIILRTDVSASISDTAAVTVTITSSDSTGRQMVGRLPTLRPTGPAISDLILADPSGPASFTRGDVQLSVRTSSELAPEQRFILYYELYGLVGGKEYQTEIEFSRMADGGLNPRQLSRLFGSGRRDRLTVGFKSVAEYSAGLPHAIQEKREVSADLQPGVYRLKVSILDGRNTVMTSERGVRVLSERTPR